MPKRLSIRSRLLILGIIAQQSSVNLRCTAYSVAKALGYSHVTARKRLTILTENGYLNSTTIPTAQGFGRVEYTLSDEGGKHLSERSIVWATYILDTLPF